MNKFCQYCGKELAEGQDVCLGCGKAVNRTNSQTVVTVNPNKVKHNGYYVSTSVIMIIIAACLLITGLDSSTMDMYEIVYENPVMVFTIPGIFGLVGAIICLAGKRNKNLLIASGICYIVGAAFNIFAISDISIFAIMAGILAGFNIAFGLKTEN